MLPYRLDDLGWYQFEWLVQALLKSALGIGVEAWGGSSDLGRDAYFEGPLQFPAKEANQGPFLFQAKFVDGANGSGARPEKAILASVRKEAQRIEVRTKAGQWKKIAHYVLITNAPLSPATRTKIKELLTPQLSGAIITPLGGADVSALLRDHPAITRSFPQLLSIQDLDQLLRMAIGKESIERSKSAIEEARRLVPVFVPTNAYDQALISLRTHHIAVLQGPPEMGKTSIAWMIGLTKISEGWEAIDCIAPETFFQNVDQEKPQIFIADDSFGRTEYDPSSGRKWERDLPKILPRLNSNRWMIWTSRTYILERAMADIDLQNSAATFPEVGSIVVEADQLTPLEKALILYRHARAMNLEDRAKRIVKDNLFLVIRNPHFTPERIRRFVQNDLPELALLEGNDSDTKGLITQAVTTAISHPTEGMTKSFRSLGTAFKWLLISLLEVERVPELADVEQSYVKYCPPESIIPFSEACQILSDSFIRMSKDGKRLDWMHPSYRDIVIAELGRDRSLYARFLRVATHYGLELVLSQVFDQPTSSFLPKFNDESGWSNLKERCVEAVREPGGLRILNSLRHAIESRSGMEIARRLGGILADACEAVRLGINASKGVMSLDDIESYSAASTLVNPLPPMPDLGPTWKHAVDLVRSEQRVRRQGEVEFFALGHWMELVKQLRLLEPRFITHVQFPKKYRADLDEAFEDLESEADNSAYVHVVTESEIIDEASRLEDLIEILEVMATFKGRNVGKVIAALEVRAKELRVLARDHEQEGVRWDEEQDRRAFSSYEPTGPRLEDIFRDL